MERPLLSKIKRLVQYSERKLDKLRLHLNAIQGKLMQREKNDYNAIYFEQK